MTSISTHFSCKTCFLADRHENIYVNLNAKKENYRSLKVFDLLLKYFKSVYRTCFIIAFYPNSVGRSFDSRQKCYKIILIVF